MFFRRVLLVEFLNDDVFNQHRTETYPFLNGCMKARGHAVRWVSLVAGKASRATAPWVVEPPAGDRDLLVAEVRTFCPTHLIANEVIGPVLTSTLHEACPDLVIGEPSGPLLRLGNQACLDRFLDPSVTPSDPGETVFDRAIPDYDSLLLEGATSCPLHFTRLVAGPPCVYRRSLAGNPHFEGVSMDGVAFPDGCSFCVNPAGRNRGLGVRKPFDLAQLQIRRFGETAPAFRRTGRFIVDGVLLFHRLPEFLQAVIDLDLPPTAFFMSCRVDEVLARAKDLRYWIPILQAHGHSINMWNVGLENFSPVENERFNKGISPDQAEAVLALFDELESAYPKAFGFREHGGFGLIVFTPWTRLEDVELNVRALVRHGSRGDLGPVTSRLQLRPGTPLELLARRDGLVDDESMELAAVPLAASCLTEPNDRDIPWHFANQDVEAVWSILADWHLNPRVANHEYPEASPLESLDTLLSVARELPEIDVDGLERLAAARIKSRHDRAQPDTVAAPTAPWIDGLQRLLDLATSVGTGALSGYRIEGIEVRSEDADPFAEITFRRDDDRVSLQVLRGAGDAFLHAGEFRIRYRSETPIDRPDRIRLTHILARLLELGSASSRRHETVNLDE